jgi:hypothetical protein
MAYEQKPGEFALFKNDKGDNAKRPDYRGDGLDLSGHPVEVACWIKEGKKGKFMSCKLKLKDSERALPYTANTAPKDDDLDPDIPF